MADGPGSSSGAHAAGMLVAETVPVEHVVVGTGTVVAELVVAETPVAGTLVAEKVVTVAGGEGSTARPRRRP